MFSVPFDRALALALMGFRSAAAQEKKLTSTKPDSTILQQWHGHAIASAALDKQAAASALANMVNLQAPHWKGDGCSPGPDDGQQLREAHARPAPDEPPAPDDGESTRTISAGELQLRLQQLGATCELCGQQLPEGDR